MSPKEIIPELSKEQAEEGGRHGLCCPALSCQVGLQIIPKRLIGALLQEHKNCGEMTEIEAKVKYVKLARSLRTYGVSFFLVKVGGIWAGNEMA